MKKIKTDYDIIFEILLIVWAISKLVPLFCCHLQLKRLRDTFVGNEPIFVANIKFHIKYFVKTEYDKVNSAVT